MRNAYLDDVADQNYNDRVAYERKELEEMLKLGHPNFVIPEIGYFNKKNNVCCSIDDRVLFDGKPTHWMELPAPPKGK